MKILLAFFCLCFSVSAQLALNNAPFAALLSRQGGSGEPFFEEYMEAPGFENVWTTNNPGATINPANGTSPLQGSFSLSMSFSSDATSVRSSFSDRTTLNVFFLLRFSTLPNESIDEDFFALNNGATEILTVFRNVGSVLSIKGTSDTAISTVGTLANNTTYYVWITYTAGSGSNGSYSIAFSEDGTKPTSGDNYVSRSNSAQTEALNVVRLGADASPGTDTWASRYDAVILSDTSIGSNPF